MKLPRAALEPLAFLVAPAVLLGRAVGPMRAPGMATEMLHGQLYAGAQVARWLSGSPWFTADLAASGGPFWPDDAAMSFWIALLSRFLDPGFAYGLGLAGALVLAGLGPWALARRLGGGWGPLVAGLLVQLSPPVLRAAWSGEIGVLAVGPAALALALPGGWAAVPALVAGAWSAPGAVAVALGGLRRHRARLLALLPLLAALASPASAIPGAARQLPPATRTVPAYVGEGLAVFPLPPAEQRPDLPPGPAAASGLLDDLGRVPGGLACWLAALLGLVAGRRRLAALGLLAGLAWWGAFGLLPAKGAPPPIPLDAVRELAPWVPGLRPPVGAMAWLLPALLGAAGGLAALPRPLLAVVAAAAALAAGAENPRLSVPVTNLPPDPVATVLRGLPAGAVSIFPSRVHPWRQGVRSPAAALLDAARHGHPVEAGDRFPADAALVGTLSRVADQPVDLDAAEPLWGLRDRGPVAAAREAGFVALVVDRRALGEEAAGRVDAWLAERVGRPLVEAEGRALYDLRPVADRPASPPGKAGAPPSSPGEAQPPLSPEPPGEAGAPPSPRPGGPP